MSDTPPISTPIKAGATGVATGGLVAVGYQFRHDGQVLFILLLGVIGVVLLLLLYRWFLQRRESARSVLMGEELKSGGRRRPQEISSPQALANLSDLQSKFDEGVEKFRAAGKNLYSLPWYLLVGEPGSGKTEVIRHCNVGFPPGLQEEQQGIGGTVNMNWWFTNYAVILDTAGRMIFDGIAAGSTAEWKEFLKLLLKARPNCPINGLLLVIPADSLIVDSSDRVSAKGDKIAQQLDTIQRTLGVRFPVFVVITKADRINGFREFFDSMDDPRLQHQILGWSNPDPLDAPFDPEKVEEHLATVQDRLNRRRLGLLLDPVNSDDPNARRLDQVDALYAFPDSLAMVAPRLRGYLERIFTVGEWSPKPLFLRGIYFTSSMREGSALDKDLADLLGVPVESLPEGRVWEQDRAFFLRDLFTTKVFREKGLVTRAGNTSEVTTRRKLAVLGSGFAAVIILSILTVLGAKQMQSSIGDQTQYWADLHQSYAGDHLLLVSTAPSYEYRGGKDVPFGDGTRKLRDALGEARQQVDASIKVPPAFAWTKLGPAFEQKERHDAYQRVFETAVLQPLVEDVREKLQTSPPLDGADSTGAGRTADAIKELLKLENQCTGGAAPQPIRLDPLFRYLLDDTQYAGYQPDKDRLQDTQDWLFPPGEKGQPYQYLQAGTSASAVAIRAGVDRLADYWDLQFGDDDKAQRVTVQLRRHLASFRDKDAKLIAGLTGSSPAVLSDRLTLWYDGVQSLDGERKACDQLVQQINARPQAWSDPKSLVALYTEDRVAAARSASSQVDAVRAACPANPSSALSDALTRLGDESRKIAGVGAASHADGSVEQALASLDSVYFKPAAPDAPLRYRAICSAYTDAGKQLGFVQPLEGNALQKLMSTATGISKARSDGDASLKAIEQELPPDAKPQASVCATVVNQLGVNARITQLLQNALAVNFQKGQDVADLVAFAATHTPAPRVPMPAMTAPQVSTEDGTGAFDVNTAKQVISAWAVFRQAATNLPAESAPDGFTVQDAAVQQYVTAYVKHWEAVLDAVNHVAPVAWGDLAKSLPPDDQADVIVADAKAVNSALSAVDRLMVPPASASGIQQSLDRAGSLLNGVPPSDRAAMTAIRNKWAELAAEPAAQVRGSLVAAGPQTVARDELVLQPGANPFDQYWQNLSRAALVALSEVPGSVAADRRLKLLNSLDAFPLAPPADHKPEMTPADLDQVARDIADVSSGKAGELPNFADVPDPDHWFEPAFRKLAVGDGSDASADVARLGRVQSLVALLSNGQPSRCTVSTVDRATQVRVLPAGAAVRGDAVSVTFLENKTTLNTAATALPATSAQVVKASYPLQTSDDVVIQLTGGNVRFAGPWPCLRALYVTQATRATDDGRQWFVPLHVPGSADVLVRFTFSEPVNLPQQNP